MANYTTNYNLKKPLGSELYNVAVQNENMDLIDAAMKANADAIAKDEEGIAYRLGNTNTTGATLAVGTYVYVTGNTNGVSNGMYKVTTAIAANGSLTTSNLGSVPGGVANSLNSKLTNLSDVLNFSSPVDPAVTIIKGTGTISKSLLVKYNSEYLMVAGTVRIPDFVRTGDNPGIQIQLPISCPSYINLGACAMQTKNNTEFVNCNISSNYMKLIVTESYTNLGNGVVMFFIPQIIVKYA